MVRSGSLAPRFVNNDCVTAEVVCSTAARLTRSSLGLGLHGERMCERRLKGNGGTAAPPLCPLGRP